MTISKDQGFELKVWDYIPEHIAHLIVCENILDRQVSLWQIERLIEIANAIGHPGFYQLGNLWGIEIPVGLKEEDSKAIYNFILSLDEIRREVAKRIVAQIPAEYDKDNFETKVFKQLRIKGE